MGTRSAVWKYQLEIDDLTELELPKGAHILKIDQQFPDDEHLSVWALVEPDRPRGTQVRHFRIAGTAHEIDPEHSPLCGSNAYHVASVKMYGGQLVFHVFEMGLFG